MNIWRQPNLSAQRDASAGNAFVVGLPKVYLKVRRFDRVCDIRNQFRKEFGHDAMPGLPSTVFRLEKLLPNSSRGIKEKITRPGHAFEESRSFGIEEAVFPDDRGIGIGKQWEADQVPVSEIFQDGFTVVADGGQLNSMLFKLRQSAMQLDQLPFAVGSPVGRTKKQKYRAIWPF